MLVSEEELVMVQNLSNRARQILNILMKHPEYVEPLKRILEYQEREFRCKKCGARDFTRISKYTYRCNKCGTENIFVGFTPIEVGLQPHIVRNMVYDGLIKVLDKTSRKTEYILDIDDEMAVREAIEVFEGTTPESSNKPILPDDLFSNIVGYEDVKDFLKRTLMAKDPVAVLLVGPPASAKSMFLEEISRIDGSYMVVAGTTTKAGLRDVILEINPRILLIDELDKISDSKDLSVLLSVIDPGHIIVTMKKKRVKKKVKIWVIASANSTKHIPDALLSRFIILRFKEYTSDELRKIVVSTAMSRYGRSEELAEYIADKAINELKVRDPRTAINIAKIAETKEDVDTLVDMMKKYR